MPKNDISQVKVFRFLWPIIWSNQSWVLKGKIIVMVLATLLTTLVLVSVPVALKYAVEALETHHAPLGLTPIAVVVGYGFLWMFTKIIDRLRHQASFPMITTVIHQVCLALFIHIQRLSIRFHHDRKSGKILNTVSRTRFAIAGVMQGLVQQIIPVILQVVLASVLLTYYTGLRYGIILLSMFILYWILSLITANNIVKCRQEQNEHDGAANAYIVDSILNAETVKYFDMADYEANQAYLMLKKKETADIASLMADAKIHLMQNAIIGSAVILLTLMSGYDVFHQVIKVSDFVMINGFVLMFMQPLSMLGFYYRQTKNDLTHLESGIALLQKPVEIQDSSEAHPLHFKQGEIRFDNVQFGYTHQRQILKGISFTVPAGTTTAIVGESGSGKSTISKLLFRLYDVDNGQITIDAQNVKDITHQSLCHYLGLVAQDTVLFNDTLYNNICYADTQVSDATLASILKLAQLEAFVAQLPDKLDTLIGERGLKLSGGERQRVAIARMLVRNPRIMVFDEATSALDLKTEKQIQDCLNQISQGITTIIIAHRLSTIQHADKIIVLDNGEIVEQGTHETLLKLGGVYSKLLSKQRHDIP